MERLVETSRGWLKLEMTKIRPFALSVRIALYGADGWASAEGSWGPKDPPQETLAQFLARVAGLPGLEATQVAQQSLDEWRERGGESEHPEAARRALLYVYGTVVLAAVGVLLLIALAVALVIWLS